ncbi:Type 1 glutamine amidotransferase-like domain-containing protein [Terracoccus luteus]|uniref:Cyanophycinase n=1 Tax=Terracoccus luteus TaxID=53356 RepID=A0A495XZQ7_9MICO|nr:Type 1 glutamine amidotransferase-like domain-containing protein [Terracoccus luteus]MBB2988004.1 cyanophycinase [Terracoccus luteus]MCP2173655.1 cyanophycinase [Terracoccus luteus]RKT80111.1 cyanophycinase [Terracoccus luteus]
MDVHLVGGGWDDSHAAALYRAFVDAAARRAGGTPTVTLVVMGTGPDSLEYHARYVHLLDLVGGHELSVVRVAEGSAVDASALDGADGLFVGGGPTPEYHASLAPAFDAIRERVQGGMPYAGFSAGAAIAAEHAVIGGWRLAGRPVCPEDGNEGLDPVTVVPGIGLVAGAVDVHAAQWGNLSRLVAVVEAGLAPHGVAIDEDTALHPGGRVVGAGHVWHVDRAPDASASAPDAPDAPVTVRRLAAGQ